MKYTVKMKLLIAVCLIATASAVTAVCICRHPIRNMEFESCTDVNGGDVTLIENKIKLDKCEASLKECKGSAFSRLVMNTIFSPFIASFNVLRSLFMLFMLICVISCCYRCIPILMCKNAMHWLLTHCYHRRGLLYTHNNPVLIEEIQTPTARPVKHLSCHALPAPSPIIVPATDHTEPLHLEQMRQAYQTASDSEKKDMRQVLRDKLKAQGVYYHNNANFNTLLQKCLHCKI